jgi:site-specific DNA-methyltransferase (adenine-specific)
VKIRLSDVYYKAEGEPDDALRELADSIKSQGLFQPIRVRANPPTDPPSPLWDVIFGKRRITACRLLGLEDIEAEVVEADDHKVLIDSIHENLRRTNLTWWDQADLVKQLHETRQAEHGKPKTGRPRKGAEKEGWGIAETAEELALSIGGVSEAITLAEAVEDDPSLRNVHDRRTALKLVRAKVKRIEAEQYGAAPTDLDVDCVYLGSALDVLKQLPSDMFDACITDPPWVKFKDDKYVRDEETMPTFREVYRVLKPDSFLYLFVGTEDYFDYKELLPNYGFRLSGGPLIWAKSGVISRGTAAWDYGRDTELIVFGVKGSPALTSPQQLSRVKSFSVVPAVKLVHPNEKPVKLIESILSDCSFPGQIILDPFAGSGSHLEACLRTNRRYVGIERDRRNKERIDERLKGVKK